MKRSLRRFYLVLGLFALSGALVFLSLMTPIVGTRADFSVYNGGWNGASAIGRELAGAGGFNPLFSVLEDEEGYRILPVALAATPLDPRNDSLVILGPTTDFSPADVAHVRAFVEGGGTLLLADDFGTANQLLEGLGAGARFDGTPALDFAFAKRPEFTVAIEFADHPATDGVERVLLNYPTALRPGNGTRVLANTTDAAWLDADGDGLRGANEPGGPFGWLGTEEIGQGTVVLLSDPSVLINGMRPFGDNERLADNLLLFVRGGKEGVVVDESHRLGFDALSVGVALRELSPGLRLLAVAVPAGLLWLAFTGKLGAPLRLLRSLLDRMLAPEEERIARADLVARVRQRHPDWDESTLRDILNGWNVEARP